MPRLPAESDREALSEEARRAERRACRRAAAQAALELPATPPVPALPPPPQAPTTPHELLVIDGRPTVNHPWRQRFLPERQGAAAA